MGKVKLPREVAEAIDRNKHMGMVAIMAHMALYGDEGHMKTTEDLSYIHHYYKKNPYLIAAALVNGYEVEQTPEDKVREYYNELKFFIKNNPNMERAQEECISEVNGIEKTLELLNIKIEGVNA